MKNNCFKYERRKIQYESFFIAKLNHKTNTVVAVAACGKNDNALKLCVIVLWQTKKHISKTNSAVFKNFDMKYRITASTLIPEDFGGNLRSEKPI